MTERHDILQEYFSLVRDLNQTNKFKNEQTQITFMVEGDVDRQLFAKLDHGKKYLMCKKVENGKWRPSLPGKYENLSLFLCREISNYENNKLILKQTLTEFILQRLISFG